MNASNKGRPRALGSKQQADALRMLAQGKTQAQVARALSSQGHKVSRQAISRLAKATRQERSQTTQAVTAEALGQTIGADIEVFDVQGKRLAELASKLWEHVQKYPQEADMFLRVQRELREHFAAKMKACGATQGEDPEWFTGLADLMGLAL
jgi:transcriptional regulator